MIKRQIYFGLQTLSLLSFVFLFTTSCQHSVGKKIAKANNFVLAFTSGTVSSQSLIRVVLKLPDEMLHIAIKEPPQDVFRLKPSVKGRTYWADQYTLVFKPDKPLKNGQQYDAEVNLNKLLGINDRENGTFHFDFEVVPLKFQVKTEGLEPDKNNKKYKLTIPLSASDNVLPEELDGVLTAEQEGKNLSVRIAQGHRNNSWILTVENVERLKRESVVTLEWKGKWECDGFDENGKLKRIVPSIENFYLTGVRVIDIPGQQVVLEFSDPLDNDQDLNGLIYFMDNIPFRLTVENNKIILYPSSLQQGQKEIVIKRQVAGINGNTLEKEIIRTLQFGHIKPAVRFVSGGTIMPGKDRWTLPFEAVNLKTIDVLVTKIFANNVIQFLQINSLAGNYQLRRVGKLVHHEKIELNIGQGGNTGKWKPYALDLSKMINSEPGAIYRVELRFREAYSLYDCGVNNGNESDNEEAPAGYYENNNYYYPDGYRWSERNDPCSTSYYNYQRFPGKNVMASNIGLTVKQDGKYLIAFTNNLETTEPMDGVHIELYDFQSQNISIAVTGQNGTALIDFEGEPYLLVAEKNGQYAYQRLDGGSALSYSKFDTKGVSTKKGIKGFIYGERGVWRPGDTLFLTVIVDDRNNPLPAGHPVTLKLINPEGKEVVKRTKIKGLNRFYTFKIPTSGDALTGFWNATATVGGAVFNKTIRIETIKPNRLKIKLSLDKKVLEPGKNKGTLNVRWLHGGIASGLKADVNMTVRPGKTVFKNYDGYNFDDPARKFPPEERTVFEGTLNSQGIANFDFELPPFRFAPGMLKINFVTKVYEQGGDFSINQTTADLAPFDTFIGIKALQPSPDEGFLEVDKPLEFEVATVSKNGIPKSVDRLEYEVYKLDWSWWYGSNHGNLASYISSHYDRKVLSGKFKTKNGKGKFSFQINYPSWGWYYVLVRQPGGGHRTGMKIYMDWPSMYSRENRQAPGGITLLSLSANKKKYTAGEEVKVSIPTPPNGRLILSLEKGNVPVKTWEMEATGKETLITFKATREMTPNVYLFVSVLQPHEQTVNDLPIRMYGVIPVMVNDAETLLNPILVVPGTISPNTHYTVRVSEKNNKNMTYTLAIVDEGLLDLTQFKTPDPHKYFYAKEALAVKTWDIYDDVMGAFGKRLEKVFAIGGDMEERGTPRGKKKANRFKPVVTFLGPFHLEKGKSNIHTVKMPNYIGSVRCMVVAGENGAYGHTQKTLAVKQPLMVLGTLPRVLMPGETVKLPVSVFVMDNNIRKVSIKVETNDLFTVKQSVVDIEVSGIGEHMDWFDLKVTGIAGIGKVMIIVKNGKEKASYPIEIQIRNPSQRVYDVTNHALKSGEKWAFQPKMIGVAGTREFNLAVSSIPPLNLEKRLKYLIVYPYGCIEQTISGVFPQLYLDKLVKLDNRTKQKIGYNIKSGIKRISKFQKARGGFSYWPGGAYSSDWGTSYAGHFLLLAKEQGYAVPYGIINKWIEYQKTEARDWMDSKNTALNQAYRLYTLALAGEPELGAMNLLRSDKDLTAAAAFRLAAAYALLGKKEVAADLIHNVQYTPDNNSVYWNYNYGSNIRDQAMILETLLLLDKQDEAIPVFNRIAGKLKSETWMSTQTTAFALYAVSQFVQNDDGNNNYTFNYAWNGNSFGTIDCDLPVYSTGLAMKNKNSLEVKNLSEKTLFATATVSGIPLPGEKVSINNSLEMSVKYYDMDGKTADVTRLSHGLDFYVKVAVHNPGTNGALQNVALSQVFPSGWEIINTRFVDLGAGLQSDKSDYTDFRDDRVDIFFGIKAGQTKSFVILLNAAYRGKYYMPVTRCAPMYDNKINAARGGGLVSVVE